MVDPHRQWGCRSAWSRAWVSPPFCVKAGGRPHTRLCNHTNPAVVPALQAGQIRCIGTASGQEGRLPRPECGRSMRCTRGGRGGIASMGPSQN